MLVNVINHNITDDIKAMPLNPCIHAAYLNGLPVILKNVKAIFRNLFLRKSSPLLKKKFRAIPILSCAYVKTTICIVTLTLMFVTTVNSSLR